MIDVYIGFSCVVRVSTLRYIRSDVRFVVVIIIVIIFKHVPGDKRGSSSWNGVTGSSKPRLVSMCTAEETATRRLNQRGQSTINRGGPATGKPRIGC